MPGQYLVLQDIKGGGKPLGLWNENISHRINKQEMSLPSAISGLQMWMGATQTAIQQMLPPLTVIAEELVNKQPCKKQGEQGNMIGPR